MFSPSTILLLKEKLPSLPHIVVERSLACDIDELVAGVMPPMKLAIVDDIHTKKALGDRIFRALRERYATIHVTLDNPSAHEQTIRYLRTQTLSADGLIAVGSGTINDLCKYTAHLDRKPYAVFPTAASMNGFLSANASITVQGHKKTMLAFMPQGVFCDLSVIANAPERLSKSGLGDTLARSTAQADWLLSHLLFDTHYDKTPFALLAELEPQLYEHARGIALKDSESIKLLLSVLLLSGLGMTIAGGSYPASGSEHMIAHTMDMHAEHVMLKEKVGMLAEKPDFLAPAPFHGETIGVTTLTMAHIQEKLLDSTPSIRPDDFNTETMIGMFGSKVAQQSRQAFDGKCVLSAQYANNTKTRKIIDWPSISERIEPYMIPAEKLKNILERAEAPTHCSAFGWQEKDYDAAIAYARYTRERFTFLDLCA